MSCSALASRSNARIRSSRENCFGQRRQSLTLAFGQIAFAGARRIDGHHHHVADHPGQLADDQPQVVPGFHRTIGRRERARAVLGNHRLDHLEQQVAAHETEHRGHIVHA